MSYADKFENPTVQSLGHSLAGGAAGVFTKFLLFPLDTIQVRSAVQSGRIYRLQDVLSDIARGRNLDDIYRGLNIGMFRAAMFHGIHFFFYTLLKNHYLRNHPGKTAVPPMQSLLRGSLSGLMTQLYTTPLNIVETRLQTAYHNQSVLDIIQDVYRQDGILGFWQGMQASVILVVNPAIVFFCYERILRALEVVFGEKSAVAAFIAGFVAKAIASIICFPLVFVKMHLQAGGRRRRPQYPESDSSIRMERDIVAAIDEESSSSDIDTRRTSDDNHRIKMTSNIRDNAVFLPPARIVTKHTALQPLTPVTSDMSQQSSTGNGVLTPHPVMSPTSSSPPMPERSASMSQIFADTVRENGIFGLYQGLRPKMLHASLTYAFIFASKEKFVNYTFALMYLIYQFVERLKKSKAAKLPQTQ